MHATGALLTGLVGVAFCPWRLLRSGKSYINDWLVAYASLLGPVLGVMLADYYIIRKQHLDVPALYASAPSTYWYARGVNPVAVAALVLGVLPTLPGMVASLAAGESKTDGVWSVVYSFSWFVGLAVAALAHVLLTWGLTTFVRGRPKAEGDQEMTVVVR